MLSNGSPPTLRDVMAATGIRSPNGVACHFRAMLEKGVLRKAGTDTARCRVPAVAPGCCPCCGRELEGGGT
jgi:SOS-response transcriptional repressor LexA